MEIAQNGIDNSGGIDWLWPLGLAWLLTTIDIILFFKKRSWYKYAVIATLIIGILGIIRFTVAKTSFQINSSIKLESWSLLSGLLFVVLNLRSIFSTKTTINIEEKQDNENIEDLKEKYKNRSTQELRRIIIDTRYRDEAKIAANEILKDRQNNLKP